MKPTHLHLLVVAALSISVCRAQESRVPVLLELFTSEGCSSCPPADQLLTRLDHEQPLKNLDLIVLGEHVDYWNHLGWSDPYSSATFTARQQHYASLLHVEDVYTPQLVVDGKTQLVGSDWAAAKAAIEAAGRAPKLTVSLSPLSSSPVSSGAQPTITAKITTDARFPAGDVYLVLAADSTGTQVRAGENSGRHLSHTAVAYSISKIGKLSPQSSFEKSLPVPTHAKWGGATRVILFVQDPATGRIIGASQAKV